MKIAVLVPKPEFEANQLERLLNLGEVTFVRSREELPLYELIEICSGARIIAFDPDPLGGFEAAPEKLSKLINAIPTLGGLALDTTSFGYVDLDQCKKRNIVVTNVPYYSTESVAEHTLAFLLCCAKRIFVADRQTQKGNYQLIQGMELKGKTLGIIGLGHIGSRMAELGVAIGMKVIAWNRSPKNIPGIEMRHLDDVLRESDAVSIHLADNVETKNFINQERIAKLKDGVIVINTACRTIVDEGAMAEALKTGKVDSYAMEGDDLSSSPLGNCENAFLFQGFGWYTKEALSRSIDIWIDNIVGIIEGNPVHPVS